jgi:protein tyrosine phosphatase (PTP) superfamily phosphohydrolase (DUF442 family)
MSEPVKPITPDEFRAMALAIDKVQSAALAISKSGLTEEALVILLHHRTRVAQRDIKDILGGMRSIGDRYLTPEFRKEMKDKGK